MIVWLCVCRVCTFDAGQGRELGEAGLDVAYDVRWVNSLLSFLSSISLGFILDHAC
jgi:hypothetical protein